MARCNHHHNLFSVQESRHMPDVCHSPPAYVGPPDADHAFATRRFQGISSLAITPGALWATWYAGPTPDEDANNYVVLSRSTDAGATWQELMVVDPDGPDPLRAFDPQLWVDPQKRLWWFWTQGEDHHGHYAGLWSMRCDTPDDVAPVWSAPALLATGVMMGKPLVLASGDWALPVSTWRTTDNSAGLVVSGDGGHTWERRGGAQVPRASRSFDEHQFIEYADGSIDVFVRTRYGIGRSRSHDQGRNWSTVQPAGIPHPDARFFISRLRSGNLLLIKHGRLTEKTGRSHLTAFLSRDDGASWEGGLLIDEREKVSYPDGQQDADGSIVITHDFDRTGTRTIYLARFREEDILVGRADAPDVRLRQIISRVGDA
jgi:predicted neuraminidase